MKQLVLAAAASLALAAPAFAHDEMAPPPQPGAPNPDAAFVAFDQPVLAFVHAKLIDGTGTPAKADMTVLVDHGRIAAVGPSKTLKAPAGATTIDATGKTLTPGWVMVHEHLFYPTGKANYGAFLYSFPRLYLAGGTTTMRTGGTISPYGDLSLKAAIGEGKVPGPDIDATGPYLNGPGLPILAMHVLKDTADAVRTVDYWAEEGATSYKAYMFITRDELKGAVDAAHARGLKITGHLCSVTYREAATAGIDNLEHGFAASTDFVKDKQPDICPADAIQSLVDLDVDAPEVKDLMQDLLAHKVALTSTLTVFETFTPGRPEAPEGARALLIPQMRKQYEDTYAAIQTSPRGKAYSVVFPKMMRLEKMFADMGGTLLAGTDPTGYGGVIPGYSAKRQVELLVEEGFTAEQAVKISTLNGATYLGRDKEVGSIAPGKRADLILIGGDPTADVRAFDNIETVFKAGVGYRSQAIIDSLKGQVGLY
jgi:imidazolonepropionase-like amidohydrolase